jgi:histidine ammonia-lyase
MIAQYTAAAMVADNRRLAAPASVDSLPTSGMQEDHVSLGWAAALKLRDVLENVERIVGIEALCAAWGLWLRAPLQPATATGAVLSRIGESLPRPGPDQFLAPHLAMAEQLVRTGAITSAALEAGVRVQ